MIDMSYIFEKGNEKCFSDSLKSTDRQRRTDEQIWYDREESDYWAHTISDPM